MDTITTSPSAISSDNLRLRFATADDAEAIVRFNTEIFDERVTGWTRDLVSGRHVTVQPGDFTVIEDVGADRVASSMVFIPQTWSYGGVPVKVARPELVASDPAYRRQGLVRKQFELLHAQSAARGELMQVITGVPWFYRQFGYEMGAKLWGSRCITGARLDAISPTDALACRLRAAAPTDYDFIRQTYEQSIEGRLLAALRSPEEWRYEFEGRSPDNTRRREWLIIESAAGERLGYVQYLPCFASPSWPYFRIYQIELKRGSGYLNLWQGLLRHLWTHAAALRAGGQLAPNDPAGLELSLERNHPLFHVIPHEWLREGSQSPWYIRVADRVAFLRRVRPALEKNLAASPAEGFTGELKLNFCRDGLRLGLEKGKLTAIERWQPDDLAEGNARFPGGTFIQLLCGWRRVQEIGEAHPDSRADHTATLALNGLFRACHDKAWVLASIALCLVHSFRMTLTRSSVPELLQDAAGLVEFFATA